MSTIAGDVAVVDTLNETASKGGQPVKAACVADKLRRVRGYLNAAKELQSSFSLAEKNPAFAARTLERMNMLELAANAAADEARTCTNNRDQQFEVEVIVPPNLPDAPPQWPIQTPPTFERPPLASPY